MSNPPFDPALLQYLTKEPAKVLPYQVTSQQVTVPVSRMLEEFVNPAFGDYCKDCSCFGTRWSCPPHDWDVAERWQQFQSVTLFLDQLLFTDQARDFIAEHGMTPDQVDESKTATMTYAKNIRDEQLLQLEATTPGSLAVSPGTCRRCNPFPCKRAQGIACDSPKVRESFSSYCGDVTAICQELFNIPLKWAKKGELPEYYVLVGALLRKEPAPE
ncbi:MAG: DUF2284 domain-containing protein [Coriobacteriia bacterium]|nr:DUF2284 domain-containing protein [Coriobacteriia bacterium]